jgi:hypothetical protein
MHFMVIGDTRLCQVGDPMAETMIAILNRSTPDFVDFRGVNPDHCRDSPAAPRQKT